MKLHPAVVCTQRGALQAKEASVKGYVSRVRAIDINPSLLEIDANDGAPPGPAADANDGNLDPASRCATEIDDAVARPQQAKALVELDQLEGGARPVAEPTRLGDVGIVELAR